MENDTIPLPRARMILSRDRLSPVFTLFRAVSLLILVTGMASAAYESPDFEREVFEVDGLYLDGTMQNSLLEALASIASNFPDSDQVDDDLREKCLAISLRISPLHHSSRKAHDALLKGQIPPSTEFFKSLAAASEAVWGVAERLSGADGEPEAKKLAPYIMEISLLLHPKPTKERLTLFAEVTESSYLPWNEMIRLQPDANPSSRKTARLFERLENWADKEEQKVEVVEEKLAMPATSVAEDPEAASVKINEVFLPFVGTITARSSAVVGGTATLKIRDSGEDDEVLFTLMRKDDDPSWANQLQIVGRLAGIPPSGLRAVYETVRSEFPVWPRRKVAELGFTTDESLSSPRALIQADMTLAGTIMFYSAFQGDPIDERFAFTGGLGESAATRESVIQASDQLGEVIASAKRLETPYLVLPNSAAEDLLALMVESEELEDLFSPQIIGVDNLGGAIGLAMEEKSDEFRAATGSFLEIEAVAAKMPFVDLARNSKVQERLEAILENYPDHISAKVMLAFGKK